VSFYHPDSAHCYYSDGCTSPHPTLEPGAFATGGSATASAYDFSLLDAGSRRQRPDRRLRRERLAVGDPDQHHRLVLIQQPASG
jgi:hypothetical protein